MHLYAEEHTVTVVYIYVFCLEGEREREKKKRKKERKKERKRERERPISRVADEDRVMAVVEDSARVEPLFTEVPATLAKVTLLPAARGMGGMGGPCRQSLLLVETRRKARREEETRERDREKTQ